MGDYTKFGFRKLGNDNYPQWRTHMRGLLQTKDIDSAIEAADDDDSYYDMFIFLLCFIVYLISVFYG